MELLDRLFVIWTIGFAFVVIAVYLVKPENDRKLNDSPLMVIGLLIYAAFWFVFVPREIFLYFRKKRMEP